MTHEHHDVVVTDRGGGGLSTGLILGIVIAILVIALLIWAFGLGGIGGGRPGPDGGGRTPQVTQPALPEL